MEVNRRDPGETILTPIRFLWQLVPLDRGFRRPNRVRGGGTIVIREKRLALNFSTRKEEARNDQMGQDFSGII